MDNERICPICKSKLEGEPSETDPRWEDDPLVTPYGIIKDSNILKGSSVTIKALHIQSLIAYWKLVGDNLGVEMDPYLIKLKEGCLHKTIQAVDITTLRTHVEKCLKKMGLTISDYFKMDKYGNLYESSQTDWTDVERVNDIPFLPDHYTIKAVHIEELRRGLGGGITLLLQLASDNFSFSSFNRGVGNSDNLVKDFLQLNPATQGSFFYGIISPNFYIEGQYLYVYGGAWFYNNMDFIMLQFKLSSLNENPVFEYLHFIYNPLYMSNKNQDRAIVWTSLVISLSKYNTSNKSQDYYFLVTEFNEPYNPSQGGSWDALRKRYLDLAFYFPNKLSRYSGIRERFLGTGSGPFYLDSVGLSEYMLWYTKILNNLGDLITIVVDGKKWKYVSPSGLEEADPSEEVWTLNNNSVCFGNGIHGKQPSNKSQVSMILSPVAALINGPVFLSNIYEVSRDKSIPLLRQMNTTPTNPSSKDTAGLIEVSDPVYIFFPQITNITYTFTDPVIVEKRTGVSVYYDAYEEENAPPTKTIVGDSRIKEITKYYTKVLVQFNYNIIPIFGNDNVQYKLGVEIGDDDNVYVPLFSPSNPPQEGIEPISSYEYGHHSWERNSIILPSSNVSNVTFNDEARTCTFTIAQFQEQTNILKFFNSTISVYFYCSNYVYRIFLPRPISGSMYLRYDFFYSHYRGPRPFYPPPIVWQLRYWYLLATIMASGIPYTEDQMTPIPIGELYYYQRNFNRTFYNFIKEGTETPYPTSFSIDEVFLAPGSPYPKLTQFFTMLQVVYKKDNVLTFPIEIPIQVVFEDE